MKREKRMIVIVENGAVAGSATCELSSRCKCKVSLKKPTFAMAVFSCQKTESVRVVDGVKEFVHEFDCESISDLAVFIVSQGSVACGAVNRRISGYEIAEVVKKYAFVKDEKKNTAERELSQEGDGGIN